MNIDALPIFAFDVPAWSPWWEVLLHAGPIAFLCCLTIVITFIVQLFKAYRQESHFDHETDSRRTPAGLFFPAILGVAFYFFANGFETYEELRGQVGLIYILDLQEAPEIEASIVAFIGLCATVILYLFKSLWRRSRFLKE
jgi:uncharacterized membrane protein